MKQNFLFYDLETTGLNKAFDQILQFAAIKTDAKFNPLDEIEFFIKLKPDIIPNPWASITHRISLKQAIQGLDEYDVIKKIHTLFNTQNTISLGYNTLNFDDEFLRFCFYRNLLPPYTHQYANNCQRMDIYPMLILYYLFRSNIINWPERDGKISLKLEDVANANQFNFGEAHNALTDVKATLKLANILREDKTMWDYITGYFDKRTDTERMLALEKTIDNLPVAIYVCGQIGKDDLFHCPVLGLGQHKIYKNQSLWLKLDNPALTTTQADYITESTICYHKKYGEPGFILPYNDRHTNKLSDERIEITQKNIEWLHKNKEKLNAIGNYYQNFTYPKIPEIDAYAALYDNGFLTPTEEQQCRTFHNASVSEKIKQINEFSNSTLHELATRIISSNYPEQLTTELKNEHQQYLAKIYQNKFSKTDYRGEKKLLPSFALAEINKIKTEKELDQQQIELLEELKAYLSSLTNPSEHQPTTA